MGRLKNPPVYFTLAQVRFNPILTLADYLPQIQERMRKEGYPTYAKETVIALKVEAKEGQSLGPSPVPVERYKFGNVENTHSFLLDVSTLTLQSTHYGTFETFSGAFMKALTILHDAVSLDYTERVGLRYLDRVSPFGDDTLEQYLAPEVLGLGAKLGGTPEYSYCETLSTFNDCRLMSRVVTQVGGPGLPPGLLLGELVIEPRFFEYTGRHAILDNDGFTEKRETFSMQGIQGQLDSIHAIIRTAFEATATHYAFRVWNGDV
ncbi:MULTISPECIES: TIGR04255 family protein [unclassified Thiomonas]|jgi:uncharacterized protein (TIGR04255 family)|uniref:TIGR04255 family protein n=1 Tax=unclassified Thiomonas TaxID=2625466 RepID=UPI0004DBC4D0|nr:MULTISPECIES: TIGR04255 family protein [unclassified Thiomonas]CQR41348.1 conserved hypothetical protein [Thiomonas sp. CB3]CDW96469.1 conserved hypothetical protein [Thiomonas sp. CB2]VDY06202.1 conserved protein of unknown function [Thiomonas sp. Bio17B3]VDY10501.1 conserved protein of unknown function [Thiomonas sp. Sup16B3]VDY14474.1 conserved protein of unknown function [Thiomonas sp. OC7]